MFIQKQVESVAKAEIHAEMEKIVNAAVQNLQNPRVLPATSVPPVKEPSSITKPDNEGAYVFESKFPFSVRFRRILPSPEHIIFFLWHATSLSGVATVVKRF
jgi:hypothetical protein